VIWSIRRLCSFSRSFTSRFQICNPTNIRGVAIENPSISLKLCPNFTAPQRISVRSQIWILELNELVKLHNLHIHHVLIRSELKDLIAAKEVGTVQLEPLSTSNPAKYPRFNVRSGWQPQQDKVGLLFGWVWIRMEPVIRSKPGLLAGYLDPLLTLCTDLLDIHGLLSELIVCHTRVRSLSLLRVYLSIHL